MRQLYGVLETIAPTDLTVLIEGETGTGKELCAEAIHAASRRAKKPFVVLDGSNVTPNVIEAELFGSVKGAFTGADDHRVVAVVMDFHGLTFPRLAGWDRIDGAGAR